MTNPSRSRSRNVQRLRDVIGRPPADLELRAPIVTRPGPSPRGRHDRGAVRGRRDTHRRRRTARRLPARLPLVRRCHEGHTRSLIVSPGRCWLPDRMAGLGLDRAAVRDHVARKLGDGRPARPGCPARLVRRCRRRLPPRQSRCMPSRRPFRRRQAPICRRVDASATRSTSASRTSTATTTTSRRQRPAIGPR